MGLISGSWLSFDPHRTHHQQICKHSQDAVCCRTHIPTMHPSIQTFRLFLSSRCNCASITFLTCHAALYSSISFDQNFPPRSSLAIALLLCQGNPVGGAVILPHLSIAQLTQDISQRKENHGKLEELRLQIEHGLALLKYETQHIN